MGVMQLTEASRVECSGKVKYSGIDTGNVSWKNGTLIIQLHNGRWSMNLEYDVSPGNSHKCIALSPGVIKKLICKAQLVIELQTGSSSMNFHLKPHGPKDEQDMKRVYEKLLNIQKLKDEPGLAKAEVKMTPTKQVISNYHTDHHISPDTFTRYSVKPKDRKRSLDNDSDEEGKENRTRNGNEKFLERAAEKSRLWRSSETTPIKFYGQSSTQTTYGTPYSSGRRPGLMPDPTPSKIPRLGNVNYSWMKPKLTAPSDTCQQQPNFHGFSNLGNTCYMNAILQSLVNLDTFTTDLLYGNKRILRTLESSSLYKCMVLVFNSRLKNVTDINKREYLRNLKQAISSSAKRFSGYQQHDAHEFLGQLLDQLKEEVTKISKSTPSPHRDNEETERTPHECINPTVQNFEFEVLHGIKCENCGEEVTKEEQFNDLSVDMPRTRDSTNPRSLQDALELSLRKENIEYTCEKCNCNKAAVSHKFTKLPRVLVLHLKRYSYNMMMSRQAKAGQNITIPRYLTLQSHCEEETRPPYPTIPPPEPKSLTVPDSPLREKNENTPRRKLDVMNPSANPSNFRFKKSRALPDFNNDDDPSKASTQQTSTPYKKLKEEPEIITDRKLTLDDDFDDPELAKALELSLKEANDRNQGFLDEVDGMAEDGDLKKVLEMSRNDPESTVTDHDYDKQLGSMTEEEQIELAMKRSMMEFEMMHDSYTPEDIRKECSSEMMQDSYESQDIRKKYRSAVAEELFRDDDVRMNGVEDNSVTSKYFRTAHRNNIEDTKMPESSSGIKLENGCSPLKSCENKSTYELTENSYFHSNSSDVKLSQGKQISQNFNSNLSDSTIGEEKIQCNGVMFDADIKSEDEASNENEVMLISDNTDSETDKCSKIKSKNCTQSNSNLNVSDQCMEISDSDSDKQNTNNSNSQDESRLTNMESKPKLSKDIENILMVDEMTSSDIRPLKNVDRPQLGKGISQEGTDIVDLFCKEEDDFLMEQWDKENYNPDGSLMKELEEILPRIDNEKGELPYSYRLVSVVNHIGSSSVVGHYVSDVYDIKKASWFSCDDSHVSRTTETDVRTKRERSGYIFFYLNKDIFDDLKDHYAVLANKKK
ncbi:ubiquitin carboxyl-terminal hydrolase 37-like isoform X1 [Mytilus californianus]|uniref:ubiquitin carboxyl-terminal hydrolase 37-like isoform X1 n=1 Tax=Mytilus californianus TaxID=6549 RepID=UPI002247F891|nr:ubiquitin carboxyl-terminal hydrolase 37-like isoform X1 [Mytilus californianus]